ncbi:hypothetical protein [Wolbachia endosymbiont (group A) of Tiphia femorata]|uniref:hypothetical protein n=1 Tax=Wolbachia endosymbiont (group A) of Tiphia femorata TaxID=2954063 RepID=UPI00222FF9B9|nr:hypothetical protein [Wolbachia endosymbiont (group A) of Tiphia femorata]
MKVNCTANGVIQVADTGSFMTAVPRGVIPVRDTGMALLHSNRKNLAVTDKIHYKIAIQLLKKKYATKNESQ